MDEETLTVTGGESGAGDGGAGGGTTTEVVGDEFEFELPETGDEGAGEGAGEGEGEGKEGEGEGEGEGKEKEPSEEPELAEFKGSVASKLKAMVKVAPELSQIFQKYPKLQDQIAGVFRREAALREVFPTVAEARMMRDQFPNGQADVQELLNDVKEVQEIDTAFEVKDKDGNYAGHSRLIENFFTRDKAAAVSLFKTLPKEWARLDKDSYNDVMSKVVWATFSSRQIPEFVAGMIEDAKEAGAPDLEKRLKSLQNWINTYGQDKPAPTEAEKRITEREEALARQTSESTKEERTKFHASFLTEARTIQTSAIKNHSAIKKVLAANIPEEKKAAIVEGVRKQIEGLLSKSTSFMRKLRPAYAARNMAEVNKIQKAAWATPWLMNKMVRMVLQKEVPAIVKASRDAASRRSGTTRSGVPAKKPGETRSNAPTGPYKDSDGRWYKKDGSRFSVDEVVAGKHLI